MGQKVHPTGIRLGIVKDWASRWYADSHTFPEYVRTDHALRVFIKDKLKDASVSRISIERPSKKVNITIHTARPGIVIGRRGAQADELRAMITKITGNPKVQLNIVEIKTPELDAALIARALAGGGAVVVQDALNPQAPGLRVRAVGHQRGILARDGYLVIEAVGHPAADLVGVELRSLLAACVSRGQNGQGREQRQQPAGAGPAHP